MDPLQLAANPPSEYRPIPFWSWNDRLEVPELARQIDLMNEAGIGGFFMHARGGLHTEYLSKEWFDAVRGSIAAAQKHGMQPWAYDENGWPSGFADGVVPKMGLEYQQKYLRLTEIAAADLAKSTNVVACYDLDGRMLSADAANAAPRLLVCRFDVNPYYVDTLSLQATNAFIDAVHERYYAELSPAERKTMRGVFTDEPQISRGGIPWSFTHADEYRQAFGDELLPLLPQLFREIGAYEQTRCRFWRLTTRLFLDHFFKPIYNWCNAHQWELTGHLVCEETYLSQLASNGAAMPHYQYFHIPGMDALGRRFPGLATPMQLASAAAQTGKKQILSETFALCGWAVSFADLKWLYQWQMVHGVNLLCQHLESYSLRGIRKRDYPASLFVHQPWWRYYRQFNDEMSRIGTLLAEGQISVDTLLIHGQSSAHLLFNTAASGNELVNAYSNAFISLSSALEGVHVNHHYGDETLMEQHGRVDGASIVIGQQQYRMVILPKILNLSSKQVQLLDDFAQAGGTILAEQNDLSCHFFIDGVPADNAPLLKKIRFFADRDALLAAAMAAATPICVATPDTALSALNAPASQLGDIHATRRYFSDLGGKAAVLYYYVNNQRFKAVAADLYIPAVGLERFDAELGRMVPVAYDTAPNGMLRVKHRFEAAGDIILIAREVPVPAAAPATKPTHSLALPDSFAIKRCTENLLTLEYCAYSVDGDKKSDREYVLTIHDELLKLRRDAKLEMTFTFRTDAKYRLGQPLALLLEHPEHFAISVNGQAVSNQPQGFFADPAFERIDIGKAVVTGTNTITLMTTFHQEPVVYQLIDAAKVFESEKNRLAYNSEIEAIYLCGDFGVNTGGTFSQLDRDAIRYSGDFVLSAPATQVDIEHIEQCGFPFFAGSMTLSQDITLPPGEENHGYQLAFAKLFAQVAVIRINGRQVATVTRPDYACAIPAGVLKAGANTIEIELTNSLRNMLGPLHLEEGECLGVSPGVFYKAPGVFAPWHRIVWNDDFCFMPFGIKR